jgi:F420-0:Gamma-glutamyl ligase
MTAGGVPAAPALVLVRPGDRMVGSHRAGAGCVARFVDRRQDAHRAARIPRDVDLAPRRDSFGRPWRQGTTDVAIGCASLRPLLDLGGRRDRVGYELHTTVIAVADQIAGAAQLVMGKLSGMPATVVRGLDVAGEGSARELVMPPERDLFG